MEKIMAMKDVQAAVPPPFILDLLTENPEQQAKKEKMVARMMHAWMPMLSEGMMNLWFSSQSPLESAHGKRGESMEQVLSLFSSFHQTIPA